MKEGKEEERRAGSDYTGHLQPSLRAALIKAIGQGVPRSVIAYQYGVSRAAISKWMRDHGSAEYKAGQPGGQLTELEKRSIVRRVEQVALTPHAARQAYGLSGHMLYKWFKAPAKENAELAAHKQLEMQDKPPGEADLPDAEKDALKRALQEAQLKISALNALIDVAEDQFKIAIRKKAGARQQK